MMPRYGMNRSSANTNHGLHAGTASSSSRNNQTALQVRKYMQSIDPSIIRDTPLNNFIPFSPAAASTQPSPLPFFPDQDSFDMKPPSSASLARRKRSSENHSSQSVSSSISSASSSFPSPPSGAFYPSHRLRLRSNAISVPCPRKTLFLSPTRAMAHLHNAQSSNHDYGHNHKREDNNDKNSSNSSDSKNSLLLTKGSGNERANVIPFRQGDSATINRMNKNHSIDITNNTSRYGYHYSDPDCSLFEVDSPTISTKCNPILLQTPCSTGPAMDVTTRTPTMRTPTRALSTPPKSFSLITGTDNATEGGKTMRTPSRNLSTPPKNFSLIAGTDRATKWSKTIAPIASNLVPSSTILMPTTPASSTPKRVSLDMGDNYLENTDTTSDGEFKDVGSVRQALPLPMLRPQPSVGTAAAASALMSMMVMGVSQQGSNNRTKRSPGRKVIGSPPPIKKRKLDPIQIPKFLYEAHSPSSERFKAVLANAEDGENCRSLSNRTSTGMNSCFHKPNEQMGSTQRCEEVLRKNLPEPNAAFPVKKIVTDQTLTAAPSSTAASSDSSTSCPFKRIPRRFVDDPSLPTLKSGMRLAAPNDREELNSLHCFVRSDLLEVFVLEDTKTNLIVDGNDDEKSHVGFVAKRQRKTRHKNNGQETAGLKQIKQRVGLRCVYCGQKPKCERAGASMCAFFPKSLQDIYRGVCTWQRIHFHACKHIPKDLKELYSHLKNSDRSRGKKAYWIRSAHNMGMRNSDQHRNGIVWVGPTNGARERPVVGRPNHESVSWTLKRQPVTLDLTTFDNSVKHGA